MSHTQYTDYQNYFKTKNSIFYYNQAIKLQEAGSVDYTLISKTFYKAIILNKNNIDAQQSIRKMIDDTQITAEECISAKTSARGELLQCYSVTDLN
jgi:hypothetical protein